MAKTFTSQTAARFISVDTEAESSAKYITPADIKTAEPFESLFAIKEEVYSAIAASMKESGYDDMQPVIVWQEKGILIDGHTRRKAAIEADIAQIPYIEKSFVSEEAALDYMYHIQFSRRNITDSELVPLAMRALESYEKKYGEGSKAEFLVRRFAGLSLGKAKQLAVVLDKAQEAVPQIIDGTTTVRSVYENMNKTKKDKTSMIQKVTSNFLNETNSVPETTDLAFHIPAEPVNLPAFEDLEDKVTVYPLLEINEGNIYFTSEPDKAKVIAVSVAPNFHKPEMLVEILAVIKKHTGVE